MSNNEAPTLEDMIRAAKICHQTFKSFAPKKVENRVQLEIAIGKLEKAEQEGRNEVSLNEKISSQILNQKINVLNFWREYPDEAAKLYKQLMEEN